MSQSRLADYVQHTQVPWSSMKGMRNRITHGYFDINLDVVWDTVETALLQLVESLSVIYKGISEE